MKHGIINCQCGQRFYFESNLDNVDCPNCTHKYETSNFQIKEEQPPIEVIEEDGINI